MPSPDYAGVYSDAWAISRNTDSYEGAWRKFRRGHMDFDRDILKPIFDRTWERAERVKYLEDSPGNWFISKKKLGCGDTGNMLFLTYAVTFNDEGGNQHEQFFHVNTPLESHVGNTRSSAEYEMRIQLRDRYFSGWLDDDVRSQISDIELRQVRCFAGGN